MVHFASQLHGAQCGSHSSSATCRGAAAALTLLMSLQAVDAHSLMSLVRFCDQVQAMRRRHCCPLSHCEPAVDVSIMQKLACLVFELMVQQLKFPVLGSCCVMRQEPQGLQRRTTELPQQPSWAAAGVRENLAARHRLSCLPCRARGVTGSLETAAALQQSQVQTQCTTEQHAVKSG